MAKSCYEWDEKKWEANFVKHHFDFIDAPLILEGPHLLGPGRITGVEVREIATGMIGGRWATVVFTRRGDVIRIISLRSARHGERKRYQEIFGERTEGTSYERSEPD